MWKFFINRFGFRWASLEWISGGYQRETALALFQQRSSLLCSTPLLKVEKGEKERGESDKDNNTPGKEKDPRQWRRMFFELCEYKSQNGDCLVPIRYKTNRPLGAWVEKQRTKYKALREGKDSTLLKWQVEALDDVCFVWEVHEKSWNERLLELKEYKKQIGNCNVPFKYLPNPQLGQWINRQRNQYTLLQRNQRSDMTRKRIELLEAEGFVWDVHEATWMERLDELRQYREVYGDCMVPRNHTPNPGLARWVDTQRREFKLLQRGEKSQMTLKRLEMLKSERFVWNVFDEKWMIRYKELLEYVERNGHCRVPRTYRQNPRLGKWCHSQRVQFKRLVNGKSSSLTDTRRKALEDAGFLAP